LTLDVGTDAAAPFSETVEGESQSADATGLVEHIGQDTISSFGEGVRPLSGSIMLMVQTDEMHVGENLMLS
jgi:hypothetical protein